jgi:Flp pilus assembly pilin Flp
VSGVKMRFSKRRGQVAIEYALLSAMVAVGIIASIFYLEGSTRTFYSDWGGQESQKVTTKALVDHYNGNSTGTVVGAPVKPIGSSGLMTSLTTYNGPVNIVGSNLKPKPAVSQGKPGKDKEILKDTLLSKIEAHKKEDPGPLPPKDIKNVSEAKEVGSIPDEKKLEAKPQVEKKSDSKEEKKDEAKPVTKAEAKPKSGSEDSNKGGESTDLKVKPTKGQK